MSLKDDSTSRKIEIFGDLRPFFALLFRVFFAHSLCDLRRLQRRMSSINMCPEKLGQYTAGLEKSRGTHSGEKLEQHSLCPDLQWLTLFSTLTSSTTGTVSNVIGIDLHLFDDRLSCSSFPLLWQKFCLKLFHADCKDFGSGG